MRPQGASAQSSTRENVRRRGASARGLQRKTYLVETQRPADLKVHSDSAAGRGTCDRVGSGKVRHLELRVLLPKERLGPRALESLKEHAGDTIAERAGELL